MKKRDYLTTICILVFSLMMTYVEARYNIVRKLNGDSNYYQWNEGSDSEDDVTCSSAVDRLKMGPVDIDRVINEADQVGRKYTDELFHGK